MELDYKNMQAGRELDAYVACKIFGYNNGKTDDKYFDFIKKLNKEILPPYSTDLNASWEVVNEITKNKHWTFKIINYAEKNSKPYKQSHKNEV